jgi:hypothetical protein
MPAYSPGAQEVSSLHPISSQFLPCSIVKTVIIAPE